MQIRGNCYSKHDSCIDCKLARPDWIARIFLSWCEPASCCSRIYSCAHLVFYSFRDNIVVFSYLAWFLLSQGISHASILHVVTSDWARWDGDDTCVGICGLGTSKCRHTIWLVISLKHFSITLSSVTIFILQLSFCYVKLWLSAKKKLSKIGVVVFLSSFLSFIGDDGGYSSHFSTLLILLAIIWNLHIVCFRLVLSSKGGNRGFVTAHCGIPSQNSAHWKTLLNEMTVLKATIHYFRGYFFFFASLYSVEVKLAFILVVTAVFAI